MRSTRLFDRCGAQPRLLRCGAVRRRWPTHVSSRCRRRGARALRGGRLVRGAGLPAGLAELSRAHGDCRGRHSSSRRYGSRDRGRDAGCARVVSRDARAGDDDARGRSPLCTRRELLAEGELLDQPGLVAALELIRDEGAAPSTRARSRRRCSSSSPTGTARDRRRSRAPTGPNGPRARRGALRRQARADARRARGRRRDARPLRSGKRPVVAARRAGRRRARWRPHDEPAVVDGDGNACVLTTSLGLGSGDWVPGLDLHLNSMLGETISFGARSCRGHGWRA